MWLKLNTCHFEVNMDMFDIGGNIIWKHMHIVVLDSYCHFWLDCSRMSENLCGEEMIIRKDKGRKYFVIWKDCLNYFLHSRHIIHNCFMSCCGNICNGFWSWMFTDLIRKIEDFRGNSLF